MTFLSRKGLYAGVFWSGKQTRSGLKKHHSIFLEGGRPARHCRLEEILGSKKHDVRGGEDIKEKAELIDETTPAKSLDISADALNAFTVLREMTYPYFSLENVSFYKMKKNHEMNHGRSFVGAVQLVLFDPSYNSFLVREHERSAYDSYKADDMKDFLSSREKVMKIGAHVPFLCSTLQFRQCC